MIKEYFRLIKPSYIFGTLLTAIAGFFLASKNHVNVYALLGTMLGVSLGIASACVFNNYIDRKIDGKMLRTKNRALVTGSISPYMAIILCLILGSLGVIFMAIFTNITTLIVGGIGLFFYEILYSIFKRRSSWSTIVGSVSGAIPPVAGYTAVSGRLDLGAILLFFIFLFWQMPHFYSIAIYRRNEYKNAGLPVLPVSKGIFVTKIHILIYLIGFVLSALLLSFAGFAGKVYLFTILTLSVFWIIYEIAGFSAKNTDHWARRMFAFSLIVNFVLCIVVIGNSYFY